MTSGLLNAISEPSFRPNATNLFTALLGLLLPAYLISSLPFPRNTHPVNELTVLQTFELRPLYHNKLMTMTSLRDSRSLAFPHSLSAILLRNGSPYTTTSRISWRPSEHGYLSVTLVELYATHRLSKIKAVLIHSVMPNTA